NPKRSLPIGAIGAALTGFVAYLGLVFFLDHRVPPTLLVSNPLIMHKIALVGGVVLIAIWTSTLSASLGGLMGAPRTLQALAMDGIVPKFLAKEFGADREPRIAIFIAFLVALYGLYLGDINTI